jgi:hypothetical protein
MRFSRAKPTGSFRVFKPSTNRVASHHETLQDARASAAYWTKAASGPMAIQERLPSGKWVTFQWVGLPSGAPASKPSKKPSKTAHATKTKTGDKTSDKTTIAALAEELGLPAWDRIDDMNQEHYWEMAKGLEGEEAVEAERAAQDEVYAQWYDADAASKLFEEHGLELKPVGKYKASKRPYELKIVPKTSWNDAANKLRETINGVGSFHFNNLREYLDSGPYTARQAVLSHLHWIKRYPDVYGSQSAQRMYEQHWR